jgi:hypothetical protein
MAKLLESGFTKRKNQKARSAEANRAHAASAIARTRF